MPYKLSFAVKDFNVDAYAINFNEFPTSFQVFINGNFEGFIFYTGHWQFDKYGLAKGLLNEESVQEIASYLMAYYE